MTNFGDIPSNAPAPTLTNGVVPVSMLGTGTPTGSKYLRDDGQWWVPPGGSGTFAITQAEIDFGESPVPEAFFSITDANVTTSSKVLGGIAYVAPTGRDLDEVEMEPFNLNFSGGSGVVNLWAQAIEGPVTGKYKVWYTFA